MNKRRFLAWTFMAIAVLIMTIGSFFVDVGSDAESRQSTERPVVVSTPSSEHRSQENSMPAVLPVEREPVGEDIPAAVSSAMPTMTLAGHLKQQILGNGWSSRNALDGVHGDTFSFAAVVASPWINPEKKEPKGGHANELAAMVEERRKEYETVGSRKLKAKEDAVCAALDRGQYESIELPGFSFPVIPGLTAADSAQSRDNARTTTSLLQERAEARYGRRGVDWLPTIVSGSGPKGEPRITLIVVTRADNPELFSAIAADRASGNAWEERFREFFRRL